jgi:DNA polymerase-3 subunit epsilon
MFLLPTTLVAFDLETTGLSPVKDEIIEIGAVKFSFVKVGERMEIVEKGTFQSLVKPDRHIPEEATRVNHITDAMVQGRSGGEGRDSQLPAFLRSIEPPGGPQRTLLRCAVSPRGLQEGLDSHTAFAGVGFAQDLPQPDARKLLAQTRRHRQRMVASGEVKLKVEQGELHRALYDCQVLAQVVGRLLLKALPEKDLAIDRFQKAAEKLAPIFMLEN